MTTTLTKQVTRLKDRFSPCSEAVSWLNNGFKTPQQAWDECERGDWMFWLLGRLSGKVGSKSRKKLVKACCACARLVLPIYEKKYPNDNRVRHCIEVTEGYTNGTQSLDAVKESRTAASAAYAASYAAYAAASASYAASSASYAASSAASSASYAASSAASSASYAASAAASSASYAAAAYAAYAASAASAAASAAASDARKQVLRQCADEVRKLYPKVPKL